MLRFFFNRKTDPAVARLYDRAVAQARQPVFYQTFGVADTLDGRFEMVVFHVCPLIDGLRDENGATLPTGQALFDTFVKDMEGNLRTIGVGDISVPKKMKKIGEAFYGRLDAYRRSAGNEGALAAAIARNVYGDESRAGSAEALGLARYHQAIMTRAAETGDIVSDFSFPDCAPFLAEGVEVAAGGKA